MFNTIEEGLEEIKKGKMIIVVDDENRENEGDLIMSAEKITDEAINFMATHAKGLICVPLTAKRLKELNIPQMVENNTDNHNTAFTVSIDSIDTTTGISAQERAHTITKLLDKESTPDDFRRPGHIFPIRAKEGGVLIRAGHTEAAIDLARLAGHNEAGVICEIMNNDGTMARTEELLKFAQKHEMKIIKIEDLIEYRRKKEKLIKFISKAKLPTKYGTFEIQGFENTITKEHHIALIKGEIDPKAPMLVRVHSECLTGDSFGSLRCDCGEQLAAALREIEKEGRGVVLYMRQEGRGIGLINKIRAYELQDKGADTVEANLALGFPEDMREYGIGAQILAALGIRKIKLMTNNPKKLAGLSGFGLEITERVPLETSLNEKNRDYLRTKKNKMGHILKLEE